MSTATGRKRARVTLTETDDMGAGAPTPKATREELLARLHAKMPRRGGNHAPAAPSPGTQEPSDTTEIKAAAQGLAARYAAGTLSSEEAKSMAAVETGLAECGGDLERFCAKAGIPKNLVPHIQDALAQGGEGEDIATASNRVIDKLMASMATLV